MAKRKEGAGREESWAARVIGFTGGGRWLIYLSMALSALSSACSFVPFVAVYLVVADVVAVYPDFAALDAARMTDLGWMALGGVAGNIGLYLAALLCAHSAAFDAEYNLQAPDRRAPGRIPLGRLEALGTGRVGKVMDESVGAIEGFLAHSLPDMAAAFTAPVAIVALLFVFDWRFGLAAVACVVAAFGVEAGGLLQQGHHGQDAAPPVNQERMTNATVEYVRGMPVVKTFGQTAESFGRLSAAVRAYTDLALDVALFWQSLMPGVHGHHQQRLPVRPAGGHRARRGALRRRVPPVRARFHLLPPVRTLHRGCAQQDDVHLGGQHDHLLPPLAHRRGARHHGAPRAGAGVRARAGALSTSSSDGVSFSYGAEGEKDAPLALDGVSLSVPEGTTCAIVGPVRSG